MWQWSWSSLVLVTGCATIADAGGGDQSLPNAGAGPFREIETEELGNFRVGPYALKSDDRFPRDASVVDTDGDSNTLDVFGYVAETSFAEDVDPDPLALPNAIVRYAALDARSFARQSETVLEPELDWEQAWIGQPSALRVDGAIWLYYAAGGGIGLGRSDDGLAFERLAEPVLAASSTGWDQGQTPASPSVVRLPDGSFRMFYQAALPDAATAIGEAISPDGLDWSRLGSEPVLRARGPSTDPAEPVHDSGSVGAPHALWWPSAMDRPILWLYYGAVDEAGRRSVGLAARHGADGPLERASSPVFGSSGSLDPTEPWVLRYPDFALLFVTERAGTSQSLDYPAVAVGVAPATVTLPPPEPR